MIARMAVKQIIVSDISQNDIPDEQHARVVVEQHPDMTFAVELDVSTDEAEKLQSTSLRLVTMTIYAPNVAPRSVTIETKTLDKLFGANVDFNKVLEGARKADQPSRASGAIKRPTKAVGSSGGPKVNYATLETMGQLHRGRLTDEEIRLVQANQELASKNREAQTGKAIDWNDPAEKKRYRL